MAKEKLVFENSVLIEGVECVTPRMVCERFNISMQTLRNRAKKGVLRSVKLPNRHRLYFVDSIQDAYELGMFEKWVQI